MALSWLSVLKAVPWTEVISNAPKVAEGARKLWKSVGTQLLNRTRHLERTVEDLHQQLQQSTELIKTLAEQNTQLVERVEMNRVRAQRTLVLAAAALALSLGALALALLR